MPLTKLAKINENSFWAAWKIEEPLSYLLEALREGGIEGQDADLAIHHPQKKLEWAAGRLALQSLLDHGKISGSQLAKDEHGKPYLPGKEIHLSLAHSYPYATAIIHRHQPVGIDIEQPSEKLLRVRHKFLNRDEITRAGDDTYLLCVFWCAKESVYKIHGRKQLTFKDHIFIDDYHAASGLLSVHVSADGRFIPHQLVVERLDRFYVVYNC